MSARPPFGQPKGRKPKPQIPASQRLEIMKSEPALHSSITLR
jgi:hypothetical protein